MEEKYLKVKEILEKYNQEQLLSSYEKLNANDKEYLLNQILSIDFDLINKLYTNINVEKNEEDQLVEPISYIDKNKLTEEEKKYYEDLGIKEIKQNKLAAVTMAGGQGTRLRSSRTKRNFYA